MAKKEKVPKEKNRFMRYYRVLEYLQENTDVKHTISRGKLNRILPEYAWDDNTSSRQAINSMAEAMNTNPDGSVKPEEEWRIVFKEYKKLYGNPDIKDNNGDDDDDYDEEDRELLGENEEDFSGLGTKGLHYQHIFTYEEVNEMIEAVRLSKTIPPENGDTIIEKIQKNLTTKYNRDFLKVNIIKEVTVDKVALRINLNKIQEAIGRNRRILYYFNLPNEYGELHKSAGEAAELSPYYIVAHNNRYYLIAIRENYRKEPGMWFGRIDLMSDIEILEKKERISAEEAADFPKVLDESFIRQHLNMSFDSPATFKLRITGPYYNFLMDAFGKPSQEIGSSFRIVEKKKTERGEELIARIRCSPFGMMNFAMQFSSMVEILEPKKYREEMKERVETLLKKYTDES